MAISFKVNQDKTLEAIVYLASKAPGIDIYHTVKTMFYADKKHLNKYARPILGDLYIKMENGPVPSLVKDIVDCNRFLPLSMQEKIKEAIETKGRNKNITAKRNPDFAEFSETDIECLDDALAYCKDKTFDELKDLTHTERAWIDACMNGSMDYELMLDDDNPHKEEIIADLKEDGQWLVF